MTTTVALRTRARGATRTLSSLVQGPRLKVCPELAGEQATISPNCGPFVFRPLFVPPSFVEGAKLVEIMRRSVLVSLVAAVAAYTPSPLCMRTQSTRSQPAHVVMKGKGSRGIPGKATSGRTASGGITDKAKKKFEIDDFNAKSEWTLVAEKGDLGAETGSTKAVAAGVARKRVESAVSGCHRPPPGLLGPSFQARPAACLPAAEGEPLRRPGPSGVLPCGRDAPPQSPMFPRPRPRRDRSMCGL